LKLDNNYLSGDGDNEGLFVSDTGKVGIGTNDPRERLHILGDLQIDHPTLPEANGFGTLADGKLAFYRQQISNGNISMVIDDDTGDVGIGTNDPGDKLHVNGAIKLSDARDWNYLSMDNDTSSKSLMIHYGGANDENQLRFARRGNNFGNWEANPISFDMNAPSDTLIVNENGNVYSAGRMCDSKGCIGDLRPSGALTCPSGQVMKGINTNGTPICQGALKGCQVIVYGRAAQGNNQSYSAYSSGGTERCSGYAHLHGSTSSADQVRVCIRCN